MSDGEAKTVAPPIRPREVGLARLIPKIGLAFVALCFVLAIGRMVLIPVTAFWLLAGVALLATIAALGLAIHRSSSRMVPVAVALTVGIAARAAWLELARTYPDNDFSTFYDFASVLASGGGLEAAFRKPYTHAPGYPAMLALLFRIVGVSALAGKVANIALWLALVAVVLWLARACFDAPTAAWALILLALWPTQIMYTSLLATEHLHLPLVWLALGLVLKAVRTQGEGRPVRLALWAGLVLGLSSLVRPSSIVALTAAAVFFLLRMNGWSLRVRAVAGIALASLLVTKAYELARPALDDRRFISGAACVLLMGTNFDARGGCNLEDTALLDDFYAREPPQKATRAIVHFALARLWQNPGRIPRLLWDKMKVMWSDGAFGATWSLSALEPGGAAEVLRRNERQFHWLAQLFYVVLLGAAVLGLRSAGRSDFALLGSLVALAAAGLHFLVEAQARYHYSWDVALLLFGAHGLARLTAFLGARAPSSPQSIADSAAMTPQH
jgi:hypothetical protein